MPLVVYPNPSISRTAMQNALERDEHALPQRLHLPRGQRTDRRRLGRHRHLGDAPAASCRATSPCSGRSTGCPSWDSIDIVLLNNPRTADRPAVKALTATILGSGKQSLAR